jgi:hypothetical protein
VFSEHSANYFDVYQRNLYRHEVIGESRFPARSLRHSTHSVENPEVNTCVQEMIADPALLEARDACELMGTLKRQWCVAKGTAEAAVEDCVTASDNLPATVTAP